MRQINSSNAKFRFKLTSDPIIRRLRWITIGAMLFSMINTLVGQPVEFWLNPAKAVRGDGLHLHNHVNHTFEFFLGYGWQPYVVSCLIYFALAFLVVSVLPRRAALIAGFSFIFGHYYGACNWLAVRWHLGFNGVGLYALLLSMAMAWSLSSTSSQTGDQMIRRLRWLIVVVFLFDFMLTSLGQPSAYWHHPEMVHEGNSMLRWFMLRGWVAYVLMDLFYCLGVFLLASFLPKFFAIMVIFGFTFGYFDGASNWLYYEWRLGMEAPVIYGTVLSSIIVFLSFRRSKEPNSMAEKSPAPTGMAHAVCC
jgi:hypothetical protein